MSVSCIPTTVFHRSNYRFRWTLRENLLICKTSNQPAVSALVLARLSSLMKERERFTFLNKFICVKSDTKDGTVSIVHVYLFPCHCSEHIQKYTFWLAVITMFLNFVTRLQKLYPHSYGKRNGLKSGGKLNDND